MNRVRITRSLSFVVALLQLALWSAAPIADAREERESRGAYAHIESHGTPECARIHTDDCVICRVVGAVATTPTPATAPPVIARVIVVGLEQANDVAKAAQPVGYPPQRAPPAVS